MAIGKYMVLRVLIMLTLCVLTVIPVTASGAARELASQAYYDLEDNVFDSATVKAALSKLQQAQREDPRESWVYITASQAALVIGYKIGD
jgi:hypothetical protein